MDCQEYNERSVDAHPIKGIDVEAIGVEEVLGGVVVAHEVAETQIYGRVYHHLHRRVVSRRELSRVYE